MKFTKLILEAVGKGIKLALDDYEYIGPNSSIPMSNDIIDSEEIIKSKIIYEKLLPKIKCAFERTINECMTYEEYCDFVKAVKALHIKVDFKQLVDIGDYEFQKAIRNIIYAWVERYPNLDLNWIDTSQIKNMAYLLANYPGNLDVSDWDVSNVEIMDGLFAGSYFNGNLNKWNVSNVKSMNAMFIHGKFNNSSIKYWDVSNVENMGIMFMESEFNQDMTNWNWNMQEKCVCTAMFSQSKMELKNIPNWLKKKIKKQTVHGLR